jgi:hypothetical protein
MQESVRAITAIWTRNADAGKNTRKNPLGGEIQARNIAK